MFVYSSAYFVDAAASELRSAVADPGSFCGACLPDFLADVMGGGFPYPADARAAALALAAVDPGFSAARAAFLAEFGVDVLGTWSF